MELKEIRKHKKMTQKECADYLGIPLRTYQNYENDKNKKNSMKYLYMIQQLEQYGKIDEAHGILMISDIKEICTGIFNELDVSYCYLFGSYAKGVATPLSDVDLLISTPITGLQFFNLAETLRESLQKKVDVLKVEQLNDNVKLVNEILKDGIRIYG